ncbi:hypothetical protein D3C78_1326680 [compost metagenome]
MRGVLGVLGIRVGIRPQQVDVGRQCGFAFQLYPAGTDLAPLYAGEYMVRIRHLIVGFSQLINRNAGSNWAIFRCKLHPGFILLAFGSGEGIATKVSP